MIMPSNDDNNGLIDGQCNGQYTHTNSGWAASWHAYVRPSELIIFHRSGKTQCCNGTSARQVVACWRASPQRRREMSWFEVPGDGYGEAMDGEVVNGNEKLYVGKLQSPIIDGLLMVYS